MADETLRFRASDPFTGFNYEVRNNEEDYTQSCFVYKGRTGIPNKPVFQSPVLVFSMGHTLDGKFLIVNHGSGAYGMIPVVFINEAGEHRPFILEDQYRSLMEQGLKKIYPEFAEWDLLHLYAPIYFMNGSEALIRASGDFEGPVGPGKNGQRPFKSVWLGLDVATRRLRLLKTPEEEPKTSFRQIPGSAASYGSGFFVTERHILTNSHVVVKSKKILVGYGNFEIEAKVVASSEHYDLAVLQLSMGQVEGIPIQLSKTAPLLGERVMTYGFPLPEVQGFTIKLTEGNVSGEYGLRDDPMHFQYTAPIQPGSSGGPILNQSNQLSGVVIGALDKFRVAESTGKLSENVNLGIHIDVVRKFLSDSKIILKEKSHHKFIPYRSCVQIMIER